MHFSPCVASPPKDSVRPEVPGLDVELPAHVHSPAVSGGVQPPPPTLEAPALKLPGLASADAYGFKTIPIRYHEEVNIDSVVGSETQLGEHGGAGEHDEIPVGAGQIPTVGAAANEPNGSNAGVLVKEPQEVSANVRGDGRDDWRFRTVTVVYRDHGRRRAHGLCFVNEIGEERDVALWAWDPGARPAEMATWLRELANRCDALANGTSQNS